jgi:hypothetical protein
MTEATARDFCGEPLASAVVKPNGGASSDRNQNKNTGDGGSNKASSPGSTMDPKTRLTAEVVKGSGKNVRTDAQTVNGSVQKGASARRKTCTAVHPNTQNKKNTDSDGDFARWYAVHRKQRSRAPARKAFERIVKAGKATVDEVIAVLGTRQRFWQRAGGCRTFWKRKCTG